MSICILCDSQDAVCAFAAQEFSRHLERWGMAPAGPVRLAVVPSLEAYGLPVPACAALDDQYAFSLTEQGGEILGVSARSVLLGVYACLHAIGFRFVRPGAGGTVLPPDAAPARLRVRDACAAALRHRGVCIEGADSLENILEFIDWLPKVGFNSFFMQFKTPYVFLERWYHHTMNPQLPKEPFGEAFVAEADRQITAAMAARGLVHHRVGHGWTCDAMQVDGTGWYECEGGAPAAIRPLLAEVDGKRDFFHGIPTCTNLCYSSAEARSSFVRAVTSYAAAHPEVDALHVWLADLPNNVCECEACRRTTLSDQYVSLLNEIDAVLTAQGLGTRIVFLLYQELLLAPVRERLRHPERFLLMFAPISRTFAASYPSVPETAVLPPYVRNHFALPTRVEENLAYLRGWQQIYHGDSFDYDYPLGRAHYGDLGYMHIAHILAQDVRALPSLGLHGYISCQELRVLSPSSLPNYVMGRMLLDGRLTFEILRDEYFAAVYGADGAAVAAYLEQLSALSDCDYFNGKGPRADADVAAKMGKAQAVLERFAPVIERQYAGRPSHAGWRLLHFHSGYARLLCRALQLLAQGEQTAADAAFSRFHAYLCENEAAFQPDLDVYRFTEVAVNYTGFARPAGC